MPADTIVATPGTSVVQAPVRYLEWGPVIAGAIAAAAISFVLLAFGSALGLLAISPYPYRGLSASTFLIVATLYAALVQVCSYAAGGYLAGRMRTPWPDIVEGERHFRDGAHGFAVWALGLLVFAAVVASGAGNIAKTTTDAASKIASGAAQGAAGGAAGGLSLSPADYGTDFVLRPGAKGTPNTPAANADRAPIARLFTASLESGSLSNDDRTYLAQTVADRTGLSQADAEKRVDQAFAQARQAEQKARDLANEARKKTALAGFATAATLALACAAACLAAGLGARDRDERTAPYWMGAARFW